MHEIVMEITLLVMENHCVFLNFCGNPEMLLTLEPHDIVGSNCAYLIILPLSNYWFAKR